MSCVQTCMQNNYLELFWIDNEILVVMKRSTSFVSELTLSFGFISFSKFYICNLLLFVYKINNVPRLMYMYNV